MVNPKDYIERPYDYAKALREQDPRFSDEALCGLTPQQFTKLVVDVTPWNLSIIEPGTGRGQLKRVAVDAALIPFWKAANASQVD